MSVSFKKLVRDTIVDDGKMRTILGVSSTGSCAVSPTYMERTAVDTQIIYSISNGPTDPGMISQNGLMTFSVQVQATGNENPHVKYGNVVDRLSALFDDVTLSGGGLTGTAIAGLHVIREGGLDVSYDESRKMYEKILTFSFKIHGG